MAGQLHYFCSSDKSLLNINFIHGYLHARSYWARNISMETVRKSIDGSYCAGVYTGQEQVGFARLITDYATFAYLADVFVDEGHRQKGLSQNLMTFILSEPFIPGLRRIMLGTLDAHGLYRKFQFHALANPERFMEIHHPGAYDPSPQ